PVVAAAPAAATLALGDDFQRPESAQVDARDRASFDDSRQDVAAPGAAEDRPGRAVDVSRTDGPGRAARAARSDRGGHLDREDLLEEAGDRVAVEHQSIHVSLLLVRSVRS